MEKCENCKYWLRNQDPKGDAAPDGSGLCRRYPPAPIVTHWIGQPAMLVTDPKAPPQIQYQVINTGSMFPVMHEIGYCGEHDLAPSVIH